jgi:hypothetical protein
MLTPMYFKRKFKFFKNSYAGPLFITDPEYGSHAREIQSFGLFLPQNDDFQ